MLLYHYPDEYASSVALAETPEQAAETLRRGTPIPAHITLDGLTPGASFAMETLDTEHGWARGTWERMGSPEPPTREQVACLQQLSQPTLTTLTAADGVLRVECTLAPWAVVLIDQIG
jgi:xylan 1,4-beta-xylosidase